MLSLTRNRVLSIWRSHSHSWSIADTLNRPQAHVVTEAEHVPAHHFGQLLNCMNLVLGHLFNSRGTHTQAAFKGSKPGSGMVPTWDRRKSWSSCSWWDSVMTRPSLCTTLICSTPMFSCSWMDLSQKCSQDPEQWPHYFFSQKEYVENIFIVSNIGKQFTNPRITVGLF